MGPPPGIGGSPLYLAAVLMAGAAGTRRVRTGGGGSGQAGSSTETRCMMRRSS